MSKRLGSRTAIAMAIGIALSLGSIRAEETSAKDPCEPGGTEFKSTIVVTATRTEETVSSVPVSVTVMSESEVATEPGLSMDNVLRTVPGLTMPLVSSEVAFPNENQVSLRGLGNSRALFLLDGVPINDPYAGYVQWSKVPKEAISRVEIVRGGTSALFGNYALGGTVNLLTRSADHDSFDLEALYGTDSTYRVNLGLNHQVSERFGLSVTANRYESDGFIRNVPDERGPAVTPSAFDFTNLLIRGDLSTNRSRTTLKAAYSDDSIGLGAPHGRSDQEILDLSVSNHLAIGDSGDLASMVFYQDQANLVDNHGFIGEFESDYLSNRSDIDVEDLGASLMHSMSFGERIPLFSAGVDLRKIKALDPREFFNPPGEKTGFRTSGGRQEFAGLFLQATWQPTENLYLLGAARVDYWKNADGFEDSSFGGVTQFDEQSTTELDPRVSVGYALSDRLVIRGAAYRAFGAPTLRDMYRSASFGNITVLANPLLGPEILEGGEVGIDYSLPNVRGQINVFQNQVSDLVSRVPISFSPRLILKPENLGTARSRGVEIAASIRTPHRVSFDLGYTWLDSTIRHNPSDPDLEGKFLPEIPEHAFSVTSRYRSQRGAEATLRLRSESKRWADAANELPLDAATIVDLSASYPVGSMGSVFVVAENVFDEQYVAEVSSTTRLGTPRQIYLGFSIESLFGGSSH